MAGRSFSQGAVWKQVSAVASVLLLVPYVPASAGDVSRQNGEGGAGPVAGAPVAQAFPDPPLMDPTGSPVSAGNALAGVPLHFEPNLGQMHLDVKFTARASGYTLFLTSEEAVFVVPQPRNVSEDDDPEIDVLAANPNNGAPHGRFRESATVEHVVVRMQFVDANSEARFAGESPGPGKSNYFLGSDPARWATDVPHYARVVIYDLWPGIDAVFYGTPERAVEYDFVVHPGADPAAVSLAFEGAPLRLEVDGALVMDAGNAELRQPPPFTYQHDRNARVEVASGFRLSDHGVVRFWVGAHDPAKPIVIDPVVLGFSSYVGGNDDDDAEGIAVDAQGSAYITGSTISANFPAMNPYRSSLAGGWDVFVTKLAPAGDALVYSTYLGGSGSDFGRGIAVDADGNAYVTGGTASTNFPTKNAYQSGRLGGWDAFVTKLSAAGNDLDYSTYLGGSLGGGFSEAGHGIAVDASGSAYVTGIASSANFPTKNALQGFNGQNHDAFVTKFMPTGNELAYSTFLGGSNSDWGNGIAVGPGGHAYVTGFTSATNFPTRNPFQANQPGWDAFVSKLAPTGDSLAYSTYLGGNDDESGEGIAVDVSGSAFVTGDTESADFPTPNAFQPTRPAFRAAFVAKFTTTGSGLAYGTFLGGGSSSAGKGVAVDAGGHAYVVGDTSSTDFPTRNASQASSGGARDAFITKFVPAGSGVVYSTYLGGSGSENGNGIALSGGGYAYVAGATRSTNLPTQNAFQPTLAGGRDTFVTKLVVPELLGATMRIDTRPACAASGATCPLSTLGFSNAVVQDAGDAPFFVELPMGDLDAHMDRACSVTDTCDHWFKLDMTINGTVPARHGLELPVARLRWLDGNGIWQPEGGVDVEGRVTLSSGGALLELPSFVHLPVDAFADARPGAFGPTLAIRIEPAENPWDPNGAKWDIDVDAAEVQLVARPVIFVHGWTRRAHETNYSDDSGGWQTAFIQAFRTQSLADFGQDPWEAHGDWGLTWFAYHKKQDFRKSAWEDLHTQVRRVREEAGFTKGVDLVTHSMGGLVSRYFVEPEEFKQSARIDRIVTIGTPHLGSELADWKVRATDAKQPDGAPGRDRYYLGNNNQNVCKAGCGTALARWNEWWRDTIQANRFHADPSNLTPMMADFELKKVDEGNGNPVLDDLNADVGAEGVDYFFIAARAKRWGGHLDGDGTVSVDSATLNHRSGVCQETVKLDAKRLKAHNAARRDPRVRALVYGFLTGFASPCEASGDVSLVSGAQADRSFSTTKQSAVLTRPDRILDQRSHAGPRSPLVATSGTMAVQWNLTAVVNATFLFTSERWALTNATFAVVAPDGRRSTPDGGDVPEAFWESTFDDEESLDALDVHLEGPSDGIWTIEVVGLAEDVVLDAQAEIESAYELTVDRTRPVVLLQPVVIEAALLDQGAPMTTASVTGRIMELDAGNEWVLAFHDDGEGKDRAPGDGVFAAEFTPILSGEHGLFVDATSGNIARRVVHGFSVLTHAEEARSRCLVSFIQDPSHAPMGESFVADWLLKCATDGSQP